jgi:putative DNA primase/helicase
MTKKSKATGVLPTPAAAQKTTQDDHKASSEAKQGIGLAHTSDAPEFSDISLAHIFAHKATFDYRITPGMGWMRCQDRLWARDDKLGRYDLAKEVCIKVAAHSTLETEARRITSAKTVQAVITLAQADPKLVVDASEWDCNQMVINTPGGMIDLRTGEKRLPGLDYVTQSTRGTPDSKLPCTAWLRFLDDVFMADKPMIQFIQRSLGYCITGDRREQALFFWFGLGANGKSVLIDLIQWLIGTYALKLPAGVLMQSKFERHPTELAQLRGKRLAVSSELDEGSYFAESLIKELTGDERLTARFMRQDFFEFTMTQKHIIVGNYKPRLRGGDPAMARRMLLVPFNAKFEGDKRDPAMLERLKAEGPAIMAWIVQGAVDWHRDGLQVPDIVRNASASYMADHDDVAEWIEECCLRQGTSTASNLYASFSRWKQERGEHAQSQQTWGSRIGGLPGVVRRKSSGIWYDGIQLKAIQNRGFNDDPY